MSPVVSQKLMLTALAIRIGTDAKAVVVRQPPTLDARIDADLFWSKFSAARTIPETPATVARLDDYRRSRS